MADKKVSNRDNVTEIEGWDEWVASLPLYDGPQAVRALKIFFLEWYGERVDGKIVRGTKSPANPTPSSMPPLDERVAPPVLPDRGAEMAVGLITPKDSRYSAFEVAASFKTKRASSGGYYLVYADGSEGFLSTVDFEKTYTRNAEDQAAEDASVAAAAAKVANKADDDKRTDAEKRDDAKRSRKTDR